MLTNKVEYPLGNLRMHFPGSRAGKFLFRKGSRVWVVGIRCVPFDGVKDAVWADPALAGY